MSPPVPEPDLTSSTLAEAIASDGSEANLCALANRVKASVAGDPQQAAHLAGQILSTPGAGVRVQISALTARAHALSYQNAFDAAQTDLRAAASLAQAHDLVAEHGLVLLALVQPLARVGDLAAAQRTAERAIELTHAAGLVEPAAKGEVNLGGVRMMRGDPAGAIGCYDRALPVLGANPIVRAMIQSNRAEALLELDRFADAERAFLASAEALDAAGQAHACGVAIGNLADLLSRVGRIDEAMIKFEDARARLTALGAHGDALRLLAEQAESLAMAGAPRASIPLYEQATPGLEQAGLKRELARACLGLGLAALRSGEGAASTSSSLARASLQRAEQLATELHIPHLRAESQLALGELHAASGDFQTARHLIAEATTVLTDRPVRCAAAWATRAALELQAHDLDAAEHAITQAEATLADLPVSPLRVRILHVRGRRMMLAGQVAESAQTLARAVQEAEAFRGATRAEMVRVSYLESAQQLYRDAAHAALQNNPDDGATVLDITERQRQRSLLETAPAAGHDASLTVELNALYAQLGPSGRVQLKAQGDDPHRLRTRLRQLEQQQAHRSIVTQSASHNPAVEPLPGGTLQGRIAAGEAYVSLFVDGDSLSCAILTSRGVKVHRRLATHAQWQTLTRRLDLALARACAGMDDRQLASTLASELARLVLGPIAGELREASCVMLAPCGDLHAAPLLTAWPERNGLAPASHTWYVPSATFALTRDARHWASTAHTPTAAPHVVSIGVADSIAPQAEAEASAVAACWAGASLLLGPDASPAAVLAALPQADIVHFAGHALMDSEFPASSRLMCRGGWITARQLADAIRPGAVVILAGCSTARSVRYGEEQQGLVRAVLGAGARAVIAAQWPLHDDAASGIVQALHRHIASLSRADARDDSGLSMANLAGTLATVQAHAANAGVPFHQWAGLALHGGAA
jgi:CHAT domain-containing protein